MASEGRLSFTLAVTKGGYSDTRTVTTTYDVSAVPIASGVTPVTTTAAALDLSDVATLGVALFKNLDLTNYCELGVYVSSTFYPFAKLKAGESYPVRLAMANTALYARANTATVNLEYRVYSE
jgi:hypothetical protein